MIGRRLGHYEVIEELGRGGMGVVYLPRQDGLDRLVAVKVLAAVDAELAARLRREARVLSELHHPHIVSIYDVGEVSGSPYFVMAYCAGGSVADVLVQQGRLTVGQAVNVLASTSSALAAMHSLGLVHRDVKPSNVLLSADGQPFLSDLGIVGGGDRSRMTATGSLLGTIGYSAPELLDNAHPSPACDTFSLGVLGYEIVSGRHPFAGPSLSGVLDAVRRGVYPPLTDVVPGVPTRLAELITSAMSLDPAQRPHDLDRLSHAFLTVASPERVRVVQREAATQGEVARRFVPWPPGADNDAPLAQVDPTRLRVTPGLVVSEPARPPEPAPPGHKQRLSRVLAVLAAAVVLGVIAVVVVALTRDDGSTTAPTLSSLQATGTSLQATGTSLPAIGARTDFQTGNFPMAVAFGGTNVWIANFVDDSVSRMNAATNERTDFPTGSGPRAVAFDGGSVWIANYEDDTVSRMNPWTGARTDFRTGSGPRAVAFDGTNVWIANFADDTVSRMNPSTGNKADFRTGSGPTAVAFDGTNVWIANFADDTVSRMNAAIKPRSTDQVLEAWV